MRKRLARVLCIASFITFSLVSFSAKAQYRYGNSDDTFGAALSAGYDVPVGNLSYSFKPAINYTGKFLWNREAWTVNFSIGYHVYKPKLDTFYYAVDESNYGTIHYSNFTVLGLYIGAAYNVEVSEGFKVYGGLDFGAYNTHFTVHSSDYVVENESDISNQNIYLAPKLGFTYMLNDNMGIGLEGKYNFFTPTGKKEDNDAVGTLYNSYSGHLVLTYNF